MQDLWKGETVDGKDINTMTITSETTIADLEANDRANFTENVEKSHKTYMFPSVPVARKFMGEAFDRIIRKCGVEIQPGTNGHQIDRLLKMEGVKVEQRTYPPDEPLYRSGIFVYKRGELMGFVSSPFYEQATIYMAPKIYIMTTEKEM